MLSSEMIDAMFEKRELSSKGKEIVAIAFIYETLPAPSVWLGPGRDPYAVGKEDKETRHLRYVLTKILPSYQPHFIPGHLKIKPETLLTGRLFNFKDEICLSLANFTLARMLAEILTEKGRQFGLKESNCSAISISGNSVATGVSRIALIVK
jgi:hypothetical protein